MKYFTNLDIGRALEIRGGSDVALSLALRRRLWDPTGPNSRYKNTVSHTHKTQNLKFLHLPLSVKDE